VGIQGVWEISGGSLARGDRFRKIMTLLFAKGFATVDELVETLDVSRMTVHRDLDELASRGVLTKVRGGATVARTAKFESSWDYRLNQQLALKQVIARQALELVEPGDSLIIDPSTTGLIFARMLGEKTPLTVVTASLAIIIELSDNQAIELHGVGGVFDPHFNCFLGPDAVAAASGFRVDKLFMSTAAVSGHTICHSQTRAISLDRALFEVANTRILMFDSSKLCHSALHVFGEVSDWDIIITDSLAEPAALEELKSLAANLIVADASEAVSLRTG